jgi:drug/metabolite transporter (DMT)-like permease
VPALPATESEQRAVLAGMAGALCIAFSAIFVKLAEESPETVAFFRCFYALPALWLIARAEARRRGGAPPAERRLAWVAGVFFAADLILWHHAIEDVGAGLATVLANLQVVLVALGAWAALDERPSRGVLVALPVVFVGVVLISGVIGSGAYGDDPVRGAAFGVGTAIAYAAFILVLRHGQRHGRTAGPLFDATASGALVALVYGALTGTLQLTPDWPGHGWLLALALTSQVLGWLLIAHSLPRLPASLGSLLLTLQPAGSVILGVVLLSESPSAVQLLGVLVLLSGVLVATTVGRRRPVAA